MSFSPLTIPSFYCPIPVEVAPGAEEINQGTVAWLDRFGVCRDGKQRDRLADMNIGLSACLTVPDGSAQLRQIYSDLTLWFYAVDDSIADESTTGVSPQLSVQLLWLARMLERPATELSGNQPWMTRSLRDALLRLHRHAGPVAITQWADSVHSFILNLLLSITTRPERQTPGLDEYVVTRMSQGGQLVVKMIPIVGDYRLAPNDKYDPRVQALEEMVSFLTAWGNDIFGYDKEVFRSHRYGYPSIPGALSVLALENDCSIQQAVPIATAFHDRVMCLFMRLRQQVLRDAAPELARYLTGLGQWIRGYLEWALTSERYQDPRNPDDDVVIERPSMPTVRDTGPVDDVMEPLPIPTIAWWWEMLDDAAGRSTG
ncbi:terpene synthase family protein [Amycolatopsis sp. H20-H5]|uniref:terpene synthase family protein n=1 Tax=Amycolatopsis sp. H20-H5 TaxID=3046309 RepID=UPI002DB6BF7E|nr:hypothetical protein [Amycolatopsis sp. H20-H5]MEC3974986.1 hypothetical protein [Amycolatopsis sp. H20-H5]